MTYTNNHISVIAFGALEDIVHMHLIISHKIAHFRLICAYPKWQPIVLIKLIFQRKTTNGTTDFEHICHLHIYAFIMRQIIVLNQFNKKA